MKGMIYYIIGLLLGVFAGCNGNETPGEEEGGARYPVRFLLGDLMPATRATVSDATTLKAGDELTIAAYNPNTGAFVTKRQYKVNGDANGLELNDTEEMFLPVGTYDFCAMTPVQAGLSAAQPNGTIPKETDALGSVSRQQMGADNTTIQLNNLSHLASQINFTVQVVKHQVSNIMSFEVQSIEVEGMVKEAVNNYLLPANALFMPEVSATDKFETLTIEGAGVFSTGEVGDGTGPGFINKQQTPSIVFPKKESTFSAVVKVNIQTTQDAGPSPKELKVKINRLAFEPGKRYLFEVNYGWDYVRFSIAVADWQPTSLTDEVGGGEQTVENSVVIADWTEKLELDMTI